MHLLYLFSTSLSGFNFDFEQILSAFLVLFAVIDIVGSIPLIVSLRQKSGHIQSEKASVVAGVLLILFLFLGKECSIF